MHAASRRAANVMIPLSDEAIDKKREEEWREQQLIHFWRMMMSEWIHLALSPYLDMNQHENCNARNYFDSKSPRLKKYYFIIYSYRFSTQIKKMYLSWNTVCIHYSTLSELTVGFTVSW
jgi:hypothetical protein